jgi:hypothetical protein
LPPPPPEPRGPAATARAIVLPTAAQDLGVRVWSGTRFLRDGLFRRCVFAARRPSTGGRLGVHAAQWKRGGGGGGDLVFTAGFIIHRRLAASTSRPWCSSISGFRVDIRSGGVGSGDQRCRRRCRSFSSHPCRQLWRQGKEQSRQVVRAYWDHQTCYIATMRAGNSRRTTLVPV